MWGWQVSVSAGNEPPACAGLLGRSVLCTAGLALPRRPVRVALSGSDQRMVAAVAAYLLGLGHQLVLVPWVPEGGQPRWPLGAALRVHATSRGVWSAIAPWRGSVEGAWQVALYTSGSTGPARAFGFTLDQLGTVARWYQRIYRAGAASVIVTSLPVTYNFTFVAGLCLAAVTGARLHLAGTPEATLQDAARAARTADRCVVLANPAVLQRAGHAPRLGGNVLIDSGGAPLSRHAVTVLRQTVGDVREGYGLTETASLTHFDQEGTAASLGTVGTPMPGVRATVTPVEGRPRLVLESPTVGVALDTSGAAGPTRTTLPTGDLAAVDAAGRLRLLGRADDWPVGGTWPRDTLDRIGPALGLRCALVRHPAPDRVEVRLLGQLPPHLPAAVRALASHALGVPTTHVSVEGVTGGLLHSCKLPRVTAGRAR